MKRYVWPLLLVLLLSASAAAERLEGIVLESTARELVLRGANGQRVRVQVQAAPGSRLRRGDAVTVELRGQVAISVSPRKEGARVAGRIRSIHPGRKEIVLETSSGMRTISVPTQVAVFKETRPARWLDLHQGETIAALQPGGEAPALVLFDPISYLVREYEAEFGPLTAFGQVALVSPTGAQTGVLTIEGQSAPYDPGTRWQLGARFTGPRDFQGVEALVFGRPARMVVSRRAVLFWFESLEKN